MVIHPNFKGTKVLAVKTLPDFALYISSSDILSVSFITSFIKLINISALAGVAQ